MESTLSLNPRADVTRSPNRGISGPTKGLMSSIIFLKKTHLSYLPDLSLAKNHSENDDRDENQTNDDDNCYCGGESTLRKTLLSEKSRYCGFLIENN